MQTKKNNDSMNIFICITLLIVLVFSFAFNISGAWFTDTASASVKSLDLRFGTVALGENPVIGSISNIVPSQYISYSGKGNNGGIQYSGNVGAFYKISFTVSSTNSNLKKYLHFQGNTASDKNLYGELSPSNSTDDKDLVPKGQIVFDSSADNSFKNVSFEIVVTIELIQTANINVANKSQESIMNVFKTYKNG